MRPRYATILHTLLQYGDYGLFQEYNHSEIHYQDLLRTSVGTFWDTTNHHLRSGQLDAQHILVNPLVRTRHQAHQIDFLPPPNGWPN